MMMERFLIGVGLALFVLMLPALYRVAAGPTVIDRIVGVNIIGTKTTVLLVVIGALFHRVEMFVDFALAYALLNFIGSVAAARYLHRRRLDEDAAVVGGISDGRTGVESGGEGGRS